MKITEELQNRINDIAMSAFVTEGSYDELVAASEGDKDAQEKVVMWEPFENDSYDHVIELADALASGISDLVKSL